LGETKEERERKEHRADRRKRRAAAKAAGEDGTISGIDTDTESRLGALSRSTGNSSVAALSRIDEDDCETAVDGPGDTSSKDKDNPTAEQTELEEAMRDERERLAREQERDAWLEEQSVNSEIGRDLSDVITKTVIMLVLALLFALPLLDADQDELAPNFFVEAVELKWQQASAPAILPVHEQTWSSSLDQDTSLRMLQFLINDFALHTGEAMLLLQVAHPTAIGPAEIASLSFYDSDVPWPTESTLISKMDQSELAKLRSNEVNRIRSEHVQLWLSSRASVKSSAVWNVCSTVVVVALIAIASALFSKDAADLVLTPIEKMVLFVTRLSANPLAKIRIDKNTDATTSQSGKGGMLAKLKGVNGTALVRPLETQLLERTFCNLAGLLQISFGAAGAEIISHNMRGDRLEPLCKGRKVNNMP
jgi:hypothetical protein